MELNLKILIASLLMIAFISATNRKPGPVVSWTIGIPFLAIVLNQWSTQPALTLIFITASVTHAWSVLGDWESRASAVTAKGDGLILLAHIVTGVMLWNTPAITTGWSGVVMMALLAAFTGSNGLEGANLASWRRAAPEIIGALAGAFILLW